MKLFQRLTAMLLVVSMLLPMFGYGNRARAAEVTGIDQSDLQIVNDDGEIEQVDETQYPYGVFALGESQMVLTEGGVRQKLTVYRLGGTINKASAIITYAPSVALDGEGGKVYSSAISADDLLVEVENPLPITAYQPWAGDPDPEESATGLRAEDGVDGEGQPCTLLTPDLTEEAEAYQWYALAEGETVWSAIAEGASAALPVGESELTAYDFRCVYTVDGVSYCSVSYAGAVYEKPAAEALPEAPADLELNPAPSYTALTLEENEDPYKGWVFEVRFADGEYKKDIYLTPLEDTLTELDEFATLTISDCIGGSVNGSLDKLLLRLADNDEDEPSQVGFTADRATFDQSSGVAALTVRRTGGVTKALTVDWAVEEGTALAGVDFVAASGTLRFYGEQTEQTIELTLINDQVERADLRTLNVTLSNLRGDDASALEGASCAVSLYNSNTGTELNLASALSAADAVDVSAALTETAGAPVSTGTVTGAQITDGGLDALSGDSGRCTVDWGDTGELDPQLFVPNGTGRIYFTDSTGQSSGNVGAQSLTKALSVKSDGRGDNTSVSWNVDNMCLLYSHIYARVSGGVGLASGWDRVWYGDKEYAYSAFTWFRQDNGIKILGYKDCQPEFYKDGAYVGVRANANPYYVDADLPYAAGTGTAVLGISTYESRGSKDDISTSTTVQLTPRTFNNPFYLNFYTANDQDIDGVPHYENTNYAGLLQDVRITSGGCRGGKLFEGSSIQVRLGNSHLNVAQAYIVDAGGQKVGPTGSISGSTVTFSNIILNPTGTYTLKVVLDRVQKINIDVSTSTRVDATGKIIDGEMAKAAALLKSRNGGKGVTLGYSNRSDINFDTGSTLDTYTAPLGDLSGNVVLAKGFATGGASYNVQWINFNLPAEDVILFNGRAYAGNERIDLQTKHLTPKDLTFYYYEEEFLTAERPMQLTLDATAVYYDADANGRIDGYFDEKTGIFVEDEDSGDHFVTYLSDGDYEETQFAPVVEGGKVHQYFMRPYYTANPVCLIVPKGHSGSERMQIMPSFITDVTDSNVYAGLTAEQKQYRTVVSGQSILKDETTGNMSAPFYTADDHYKYTAIASKYSYVDIPLGGVTTAPAQATTSKNGEFSEGGVDYYGKNGLKYYYNRSGPNGMGDAVFTWTPAYEGNLLYNFADPAPVYIAHSLAGDRIPVTSGLEVWYLKADGSHTTTAPTDKTDYLLDELGKVKTEVHATAAGKAALNQYLGAFGGNDTFALTVNEQKATTGQLRVGGLSALADDPPVPQTITRATVGVFPDSSYLQQSGSAPSGGKGSNEGKGDYEEFSSDADTSLFSFSSEMLGFLGVETDGYEVSFSVGIPVYGKDNGGSVGSAANTFDDVKETAGKVKDFINAVKGKSGDAFSKLAGEDLDSGNLKSKSVEFTVTVSLGIVLKYNPLDNTFKFSEAALGASAGVELRLQYRFTPVPIIYVYAQFSLEGSFKTGLGQERDAVLGSEVIASPITIYEAPTTGQSRQYYFTLNQKAFQLTFNGKVYMECYEFEDNQTNGQKGAYDKAYDTLGEKPGWFTPGYLSSDGKDPTEVVLKAQKGFGITPVVVVLTVMDDGSEDTNATAVLNSLRAIEGVEQDLYWQGWGFSLEGSIELGAGVGIDIAKVEIFVKAGISFAFTIASYDGDEYQAATIDEFGLSAGIGFRVVFLFFNYEQDLIEYHLNYDGDKWSHGWSALGGTFGGDTDLSAADADDGKVHVYITPPSQVKARAYSNNVTGASELGDLAYDTASKDFQVSGFGSSVTADKLMGDVETGYEYQVVTVGDKNYVVYTGTREDAAAAVDNTQLWLSLLQESITAGTTYGFVNPIAGEAGTGDNHVVVDADDTGDLDFYAWADGDDIHVLWVSYANATPAAKRPDGSAYKKSDTEMTVENYQDATFVLTPVEDPEDVLDPGTAPKEADYYTTTAPATGDEANWKTDTTGTGEDTVTTYYASKYDSLQAAKDDYTETNAAYETAKHNYDAYLIKQKAYDDYAAEKKIRDAWYNYFFSQDVQNQIVAASQNTVVKHAVFNTADTNVTGFSDLSTVSAKTDAYYFLPVSAGGVTVTAQAVPFTDNGLENHMAAYGAYLNTILNTNGTGTTQGDATLDGGNVNASYIAATKAYRMAYEQSLRAVHGSDSKLTVAAADGTPYADGAVYLSQHQTSADAKTSEVLTNLQMTALGDTYYLAYVTQEDRVTAAELTELTSISRLYLRTFTIADNTDTEDNLTDKKVIWGEPYLLRTIVDHEQDNSQDGVYKTGVATPTTPYQDPYIANLKFLNGKIGDKLTGTEETFEPFAVTAENFLLFEMNGDTYVIREDSLKSITTGKHKGTISHFFTAKQRYGDAIAPNSSENLSSGKSEVVIGADSEGGVAAVYTASVPNTVNNAIYIAYWDPDLGEWSDGVMLAMNRMSVYEASVANGWDAKTTEEAYFDVGEDEKMTQFTFSGLQIALGRKLTSGSLDAQNEGVPSAAAQYGEVLDRLGITPAGDGELNDLADGYTEGEIFALTQEAELLGYDTETNTTNNPELLILTQGALQELETYEVGASTDKSVIAPARSTDKKAAARAKLGLYAISYGKGVQQVGSAAIRFAFNEFTVGSQLYASVSFKNVGSAAIRGSEAQPITVQLMLHDSGVEKELASWSIEENIAVGQPVKLATDTKPCAALTANLGDGDYFFLTVKEHDAYITGTGGDAYSYASNTKGNGYYVYTVEDKPELGVERLKAQVTDVTLDGKADVDLSFDVTNRGNATAEEVFVQFSYLSGYDKDTGNAVYTPLDLSDNDLFVSQQKYITDDLSAQGTNDLANGILYLGTDDRYYRADYYITAAEYNALLGKYYSTSAVAGWREGVYAGVNYWYNHLHYNSAYAAYTAGQEAVAGWTKSGDEYYNNSYASLQAAKDAATAARRAEYFLDAAGYEALSQAQKKYWWKPDGSTEYIPLGYKTTQEAQAAYDAAINNSDNQDIRNNYCRTVSGSVRVSPDKFLGAQTGSLNIRVEVFSKTSSAGSRTGLYTSDHTDEYYATNNQSIVQLEQTSFISAAPRVTLAQNSTHRLPVTVRTTTGKAPQIRVVEADNSDTAAQDELSTLYFVADTDSDGVPGTVSGTLVVVGRALGSGAIHIVDEATNATYAIAYTVAEPGDGTNIYNDDDQFAFFNADGTAFDHSKSGQSWTFKNVSAWLEEPVVPYLGNLAVGETGASFTFTTKASSISFNMIGSATVTSNKFPGTFTVSGTGEDPATATVDFGNTTSLTHTITVKVTGGTAQFDTLKLGFAEGYTPKDDASAPGLYFSRSFPAGGSVENGQTLTFTVYALDESGLQSMTFNGETVTSKPGFVKMSDGLWSYDFTVNQDVASFSVAATDTNGNPTHRSVNVNWFAATPQNTEYGVCPALTATIKKYYKNDSPAEDLYAPGANVTFTNNDTSAQNWVAFDASAEAANLSYYSYDKTTGAFTELSSSTLPSKNGCYMVRADETGSFGTWSARIFYVDCFTPMPTVTVTDTQLTKPNGFTLAWSAVKHEESPAYLTGVTVNGTSLTGGMAAQEASYAGTTPVYYGGIYLFSATDTKGVQGVNSVNLTDDVPVDVHESAVLTHVDAWGQPDATGARRGSITIDFSKVTGGNYTAASATGALSAYDGSYKYAVIPAADCAGRLLPGTAGFDQGHNADWLNSLDWKPAPNNTSYTVNDLTAMTDGDDPDSGKSDYVVLIRDAVGDSLTTMAKLEVTLLDNAIDLTSLSKRLASTDTATDGEVYASAAYGETGEYEFAILPTTQDPATIPDPAAPVDLNAAPVLPVYQTLPASAFEANGVKWQLADWDTPDSTTFTGLKAGGWQVAIRALYGTEGQLTAVRAAGQTAAEREAALKTLVQTQTNAINGLVRDVADAHAAWLAASETAAAAKTTYDDLEARQLTDNTITAGQVDAAKDALDAALCREADAEAAYGTVLTDRNTGPGDIAALLSLRTAWLAAKPGDDRDQARAAYDAEVLTLCTAAMAQPLSDRTDLIRSLAQAHTLWLNAGDADAAAAETAYKDLMTGQLTATANAAVQTAKAAYDDLVLRQQSDHTVTDAQITAAETAWTTAENTAAQATQAAQADVADLVLLRTAWLNAPLAGDARATARAAYVAKVRALCLRALPTDQDSYTTQIAAAEGLLDTAKSAYDAAARALTTASAAAYTANAARWDGLLTGADLQVTMNAGTATSLKAVPSPSSSWQTDGSVRVTAYGGSAYDGGTAIHYQYAVLPIKDRSSAVDYTGHMADIDKLDLNWQFADDLKDDPQVSVLKNLGIGWYQVFVRMVYDGNVHDGMDLNTALYDGTTADLATLRAAWEAATDAAAATAVGKKVSEALTLYNNFRTTLKQEDEALYLAAVGSDATVLAAQSAYETATADRTALYRAFRTALNDYFTAQAEAALNTAGDAYQERLRTLNAAAQEAYDNTPGYYDTASYATVQVVQMAVLRNAITEEDVVYGDGEVTFTIEEGAYLTQKDLAWVLEANKTLKTHLLIGDRHVLIPAGMLKTRNEITEIMTHFTGGTGSVVEFTPEGGESRVVPISLAEDGKAAYLYQGPGAYRTVESPVAFDDVAGHWALPNITFAAAHRLFRGMDEDSFGPELTMTRAMLLTVLYRAMNEPAVTGEPPFTDVPAGVWYTNAVIWGYQDGIVNGVGNGRFDPNGKVTREQMITMLHRFLQTFGFGAAESTGLTGFPDNGRISAYAQEPFSWAVAAGVVAGTNKGLLAPADSATRAQVAAVLERTVRYILK